MRVSGGFHFGSSGKAVRLVAGGDSLSVELGSSFLGNEFSFTWWSDRNVLALNDWAYRACLVLFTNPSARAGYDTRSIFKRSLKNW